MTEGSIDVLERSLFHPEPALVVNRSLAVIRSPLGLRLEPAASQTPKDQLRQAAALGAKGVVLDAIGDLSPDRISDTGRRDVRHTLRSVELSLIALGLPSRRSFDTDDDLDNRLARADRAFALAYELGAKLMLLRAGTVPDETDKVRRAAFVHSLTELGRRADHRGVRLAIETGTEPGSTLKIVLDAIASPGLAASIDPGSLLRLGHDPIAATRDLAGWVAHAYATDAANSGRVVGNPRGFGFAGGVLDWEEYLGSLEEVEYRGYMTVWPDATGDVAGQFSAMVRRLSQF